MSNVEKAEAQHYTKEDGYGAKRTENVYEGGKADARQGDATTVPSRFRPQYRTLTPEEKQLHDDIKGKAVELETLYNQVKDGRYKSLALTELEKSIMWIIKELTA